METYRIVKITNDPKSECIVAVSLAKVPEGFKKTEYDLAVKQAQEYRLRQPEKDLMIGQTVSEEWVKTHCILNQRTKV